jgi:5-methyltetrahydropteroyltriglutamate--homocysteine methyltransferase
MCADEYYNDRVRLLMDLSKALNREYHALADAGAPIIQIEEPAIHQMVHDPKAPIKPHLAGWSPPEFWGAWAHCCYLSRTF